MSNIVVSATKQTPVAEQPIEICERKGVGHPDSICDAVMDRVSVALSSEYLSRFGRILHHNIDKGLLVAGKVECHFGGGEVLEPMLMVFGDRATFTVGNEAVPVERIVESTAREWFRQNLPLVDPGRHVRYQVELKQGSQSLVDVFERGGRFVGANDTSAAVGFAPMTMTERTVLETDMFLNSSDFVNRHPEVGRGTKVMGVRRRGRLHLTVAAPFVDRFVDSEAAYFRKREEVRLESLDFVRSRTNFSAVDVALNTADLRGRGVDGAYLTVLGTPADGADSGQVGRGNRVNGIIPLNRPTCSEAAAGKNPVNHVGKIYNFLTYKMANRIHAETPGVREAYVWLLSEIGQPVDQPKIASVQLILDPGTALAAVSAKVEDLVSEELANITKFSSELAHGRLNVC